MSIAKDCCLIFILFFTLYYMFKYNYLKNKFTKEKRLFFNILGHDLRVPIIAQIRGLNLISKNISGTHNQFILNEVNKSCEYTMDMVTMLMNIYKIEVGETTLNFENIDFYYYLNNTLDKFHNIIADKNLKFLLNVDKGPILVDKKHFIKALKILLDTAIKYSANDSTISVILSKAHNKANLRIHYIGHSISDEEYSRMFDLNPTYSAVGQGIQMYLLKKIIDLHKGKIQFCPKSNQNNSFDITLQDSL